MGKLKVNLIDKTFHMCGPSCGTGSTGIAPVNIEWQTSKFDSHITVYTDMCLQAELLKTKYNIGWIIESRAISPHLYTNPDQYNRFDYILTHDHQLLTHSPKFVFTPLGGHWIYENDCKVHQKSKLLSIIASSKRQAIGHQLRHAIINKYQTTIDGLYGRGYQPIDNKILGLKDYRFHIVVENIKTDYWFTEKLIDAFLTGCVPIYYGSPSICKFFDSRGILSFNTIEELDSIITKYVNPEYYTYLKDKGIIEYNYQVAQQYKFPEDYMYEHLLKELT